MWQLPKMSVENILMYLRKSRTDDPTLTVDEVLAKHEQMLDEWVGKTFPGQAVPKGNRYLEVVSGETIDSRPQMLSVLRRMESPRVKAILCVEPQRLSRGDLEDIGRLVKLLRYTNTIVITLQYVYNLQDEHDRDYFERELKRGNEFLEYQKRIMNNGRLLSVQNGNFIGQKPPYGYKKAVIKEGKKKCHTLEPDPDTAPVVKMVFEWYAAGDSAHEIARKLNGMGIPAPMGGAWTAASVKPMVTNDHYIGMVHWYRRREVKVVEDGVVVKTKPYTAAEELSYPGKHPAIIDRALWDAVQAVRATHLPIKDKARYANPFAGLVRCQCGGNMTRREYKKGERERSAPRLLCQNQTICRTPSCTLQGFTEALIPAMEQAVADFSLKLEQANDDSAAVQAQVIEKLEKRLEELDRQELSMWDKYTQEAMPKHIFETLHDKLLSDRAAAQTELEEARSVVPPKIDYAQKRETFLTTIATLKDPSASVREQNLLLKKCITSITYHRKPSTGTNRRWSEAQPIELDIHFNI